MIHQEHAFEAEICAYLAANGWEYSADDTGYDRARALFSEDVIAWVQQSQPKAWDTLVKKHPTNARDMLLTRVREVLDGSGTLHVLRQGVDMLGVKERIKLAEFKPAFALNPEILARYQANRLRVVRQVHYSVHNQNSIDLVLFLNGIPVATCELKTDFTQTITDAVDQYRYDRNPQTKGQIAEPLLSFPRGALVHFAVSNKEVKMTTRLSGLATAFLPFNLGDSGASGNPPNSNGHRTAYLWEQVWARESWLEILGRYLVTRRDTKKHIEAVIFPRFHQLDVTRKLQAAVMTDPRGTKYLVQHSAGSGKTNSIAWTAHFFSELHDAADKKVFDSVVVVSDRNVIDTQLQEAIFDFQRTTGVVATITGEGASKSAELAAALSGDKKIVVCTIQTFPHALKAVRKLAATEGKRFAVIADEAHSSQSGSAASRLKEVLSVEEIAALDDGGEVSTEDILAALMKSRAADSGITFVAFTATPKNKTMELFGTLPDPSRQAGPENVPVPFHVYSMRQAIEEKFILDVLKNYTPYSLAFKLAHEGKEFDEQTVEKSAALKKIMGWVKLHPYNIAKKVEIVVEHFRSKVAGLLGGTAKAMVVVTSRIEAVRWKLAIDKYIYERGYAMGTLVAFSGEVVDKASGEDPFTEKSPALNPKLKKRDIREAFKGSEYQILLVANKFQTGFDQPLLCGMYVDRRLAGIQAVQTLSRLNRAHPGKDTTYVLDFVNDPTEILAAFKTYYETAELSATTDPNLVFTLRTKLDSAGYYDDFEVDRVANAELNPTSIQSDLVKAIEPVYDRLMKKFQAAQMALKDALSVEGEAATKAAREQIDALMLFKIDMGTYSRLYTFLSQIFDYGNTELEKRAIFYKRLLPLLEFGRERDQIDVSKLKLTHHALKKQATVGLPLSLGESPKLDPLSAAGSGLVQEPTVAYMKELIAKINALFEGELTDGDTLGYMNVMKDKLLESTVLAQQAAGNSKAQFAISPDLMTAVVNAAMAAYDAHASMSSQMLNSPEKRERVLRLLLEHFGLWESLKARATAQQ